MRSYKTAFIFASALALLADAKTVVADVWNRPSQREYESGNGKHLFRVTPDPQFWKPPLKLGACHGALYIRTNGRLTLQWERNLINNVAPIFALVSDSGKYVVTISEWHDYEVLPVAIYGKCGLLINVFGRLEQIAPHLPDLRFPQRKRLARELSLLLWAARRDIPSEAKYKTGALV